MNFHSCCCSPRGCVPENACSFVFHSAVTSSLPLPCCRAVNEPWDKIPMSVLKEFYWRSYQIVQLKAPHWVTLLHDSFRLTPEVFGSFMRHCDNYALDSHIYQAWAWENPARWFQVHACEDRTRLREMEALGVPVIVGEWSLATDNCAMWLNGFNDNGTIHVPLVDTHAG